MKYPTAKQVVSLIEGLVNEIEELDMELVFGTGRMDNKFELERYKPVTEAQREQIIQFISDVNTFTHFFGACGRRNHKSDLPKFWEKAKQLKKSGMIDIWKRDDWSWHTKMQKRIKEYDKKIKKQQQKRL
jgi:hypothetical protein